MATTEFLAFATGGGANVVAQATFNAASWRTAGFSAGVAVSENLNKVWRQSSFMAAALSQAVADLVAINMVDDGNLASMVTHIKNAIAAGGTALTLTAINTAIGTGSAPVIGRTPASGGSGYASFRLPHGAAPTTNLTNGDFWSTTTGFFGRVNGATVQFATTAEATYTANGGITKTSQNFALTDMAEATVKGRAAGAGAGAPQDLTPAQMNFMLGFTGTIVMRANPAIHAATELLCDGSAVSRTTYANLFSVIGTTWGAGNGTTTFNLPNYLGKFPRAFDDGAGVDVGRVFAASQDDAIGPIAALRSTSPGSANDNGTPKAIMTDDGSNEANAGFIQGVTSATETRPVNETFYPCIKI